MSAPHPSPRSVWIPVGSALAVVLLLSTFGSFAVGFGVLTGCTDTYGCAMAACGPCASASAWLGVGWVVQGVLLLLGGTLVALAVRNVRTREVRLAGWLLGPVSIVLMIVTTVLAVRSY